MLSGIALVGLLVLVLLGLGHDPSGTLAAVGVIVLLVAFMLLLAHLLRGSSATRDE
jgi:purine-cytosine permease-like protein